MTRTMTAALAVLVLAAGSARAADVTRGGDVTSAQARSSEAAARAESSLQLPGGVIGTVLLCVAGLAALGMRGRE